MSYKIAVASSDGENIDRTFGSAEAFLIYEVTDEGYRLVEQREFQPQDNLEEPNCQPTEGCTPSASCRDGNGCGNGGGCGGGNNGSAKVELIADCRSVVCKKIGFHIQKQLERKAISAFDVSCSVEEALDKITDYYRRIDRHESLRGQK